MRFRAVLQSAVVAGCLVALAHAPNVGAHGAEGHEQGPYDSTFTGFVPAVSEAGLEVQVIDARWVMLVAAPGRTLGVVGYFGEPFLRISGTGGWEMNANSRTARSQNSFEGESPTATLPGVDGNDGELWVHASVGREVIWEDDRVRWQGSGVSPVVTDVDARTKLFDWAIPLTAWDGSSAELQGVLYYDPAAGPVVGEGSASQEEPDHQESPVPVTTPITSTRLASPAATDGGVSWLLVLAGMGACAVSAGGGAVLQRQHTKNRSGRVGT